jgi:thiol-disulfide isomerase/thioredoxin
MENLHFYNETQADEAFAVARELGLPVLVDFWSEGCKGCCKMEEITYRDPFVISYLNTRYVMLKFNTKFRTPGFRNTYISSPYLWTPTLIIFSNDGSEVRKSTGYLPPALMLNELELGRALAYLRKAKSPESLAVLSGLLDSSTCSLTRQEAYYWAGVAAFYANRKTLTALLPYWEKLLQEYPGSDWAARADCLDVAV